jgi:hypothetical protein
LKAHLQQLTAAVALIVAASTPPAPIVTMPVDPSPCVSPSPASTRNSPCPKRQTPLLSCSGKPDSIEVTPLLQVRSATYACYGEPLRKRTNVKPVPDPAKTQVSPSLATTGKRIVYASFFFFAPLTFAVPRRVFCLFLRCLPVLMVSIILYQIPAPKSSVVMPERTLLSAGLLNLRGNTDTDQSVVGLELLQCLWGVVDESETSCLSTTELGS